MYPPGAVPAHVSVTEIGVPTVELIFVVRLLQVGGVTGAGVDVVAVVAVGIGEGVGVEVEVTPHALYGADPAHADIFVVHWPPAPGQQ